MFDRELKQRVDLLTAHVIKLDDRLEEVEKELREWRKVWATQTTRSRRVTAAGMGAYLRRLEAEDEKMASARALGQGKRTATDAEEAMKERDENAS